MDANRETMQVTWDQERSWALRAGGILEQIRNRMLLLVSRGNLRTVRQKPEPKFDQIQLPERELMLLLAERAYRVDHGNAPGRTEGLVPDYLRAILKHTAPTVVNSVLAFSRWSMQDDFPSTRTLPARYPHAKRTETWVIRA